MSTVTNNKFLKITGAPIITVVLMFLLALLTIAGTFYQVNNGIYAAQERFFSSWIILFGGFIPFPGVKSVIVALFVNLLAASACRFRFTIRHSGLLLAHLGIVLMIIGAAVSHYVARETVVNIAEGETVSTSQSSDEWELAMWRKVDRSDEQAFQVSQRSSGQTFSFDKFSIDLTITSYFPHSTIKKASVNEGDTLSFTRLESSADSLISQKRQDDPAHNVPGAYVSIGQGNSPMQSAMLYGNAMYPIVLRHPQGDLYIALKRKSYPLPVTLTLVDFEKKEYIGTSMASSYASHVRVKDVNGERDVTISMNRPLRSGIFTFYQYSYGSTEQGELSSLAVVENPAGFAASWSTIMMAIGMILHFILMLLYKPHAKSTLPSDNKKSKTPAASALLVLVAFGAVISPARASTTIDASAAGSIIVLEDGRKKPLDTYARNKLLQFSGRRKIGKISATQWLVELMFTPDKSYDYKVFLIDNPDVLDALGVAPQKRRYSFSQINNGLQNLDRHAQEASAIKPEERTNFQQEVLRLYQNVQEYLTLSSLLSFTEQNENFPLVDTVARVLDFPPEQHYATYLDLVSRAPRISEILQGINRDSLTEQNIVEHGIIYLSHAMFQMGSAIGNPPIHLIPAMTDAGEQWQSPWGLVSSSGSRVFDNTFFNKILSMQEHFRSGNQDAFDQTVALFNNDVHQFKIGVPTPGLELFYNKINPFLMSKGFYGLAALFALFSILFTSKLIRRTGLLLILLSLLPHTFGLIARTIIMGRPPVSTLYETFVFVAWAAVLLGLVLEFFVKNSPGVLVSSIAGFSLLHLAGRFGGDGDTMGMLVAVLNSNFWLTTHITTIALGYAGCCCAGIIGHVYMLQRAIAPANKEKLLNLDRSIYAVLAFGYIFTVIGTLLGGLWAEQAWGRFWGWDPKENGALLIILWCTIVFHARSGKLIRDLGTAIGSIIGLVLVLFAWIGVNLLGIGMHSYGFTSAGAHYLIAGAIVETVFLIITGAVIAIRQRTAVSA